MLFLTVLQFGKTKMKAPGDIVSCEVLHLPAVSQSRGSRGDKHRLHKAGDMEGQREGPDESPLTLARMSIPLERTSIS